MLKSNIFLISTFILLALTVSAPSLFFSITSKENNWPLTVSTKLAYMEEETYIYAAHVQQILNGYFKGDPYLWEHRFEPFPYFGELAAIIPVAILSVIAPTVAGGFLLADVVSPALLFLLIFYFLTKLEYEKNLAIVAAVSVITIPYLSMLFPKLSSYGTELTGDAANAIFFSRTPHPQISAIFLFAALFLTTLVLKKTSAKIVYLWAFVLGLSLYSSPFISSTVFLSTVIISPFLLKKIPIRTLVIGSAIAGVLSLPFFINMLQLQKLLVNSDFLIRTTFPQEFLFPRQIRFLLIAFLLFKLRKNNLSWVILAYTITASIIADAHQIITGRNLEADHWITRVLAPISTVSLFLIVAELIQKFRKRLRTRFFWQTITIVLILIAATKQYTWTNAHIDQAKLDNFKSLTNVIERNTQKDDIIGSLDPQVEKHVTGLTGRRVYLAPGDRTLAQSQEQIQRICDLAVFSKNKQSLEIERNLLNYALGFNVWLKEDVSDIQADIRRCIEKDSKIPKYKLDFLVEKDDLSENWRLVPVTK